MTFITKIFALGATLIFIPTLAAEVLVARTALDIVAIDLESGNTVGHFPIDPFGPGARGLEWDGENHWVSDALSGDVWKTNETFDMATFEFALPVGNVAVAIALVRSTMFVNGQSSVPPDTLFAVDPISGTVLARHAMPNSMMTLGDLAEVNGQLWGVQIGAQKVWRIDTLSGNFLQSFSLPSNLAFAITGNGDNLLIVDNSNHTVYSMNLTNGTTAPLVVLTESDFILSATNRGLISTPVESATWADVKRRFGAE